MARYFEARHAQENAISRTHDHDTYDDISQNSLLPTPRDPNLWIVKVMRPGEEKMVVLQLLRKCIAMSNSGNVSFVKVLAMFSVFSRCTSPPSSPKKACAASSTLRRARRPTWTA